MRIYLASPYSSPHDCVRIVRYNLAVLAVGTLLKEGYEVFSPVAFAHPIAQACKLPTDISFWFEHNKSWIQWANEFWVLALIDWSKSAGIATERTIAYDLKMRQSCMTPTYIRQEEGEMSYTLKELKTELV